MSSLKNKLLLTYTALASLVASSNDTLFMAGDDEIGGYTSAVVWSAPLSSISSPTENILTSNISAVAQSIAASFSTVYTVGFRGSPQRATLWYTLSMAVFFR